MNKDKNKNKGFTLVELLVVILIIGVLAAIAVPQYQRVLDKAHLTQIRPLVNYIIQEQNAYHLANGFYTKNLKNLGMEVTKKSCKIVGLSNLLECKGGLVLNITDNEEGEATGLKILYCPTLANPDYKSCVTNRVLQINYRFWHATGPSGQRNGTWVCNAYGDRGNPLVSIFCPN